MVADELPHPQQQLPLPTNDLEAQPGGGWPWPDLSLALGPDEANHAASAPMGSQGSISTRFGEIPSNLFFRLFELAVSYFLYISILISQN
jgi:hypothetical protein